MDFIACIILRPLPDVTYDTGKAAAEAFIANEAFLSPGNVRVTRSDLELIFEYAVIDQGTGIGVFVPLRDAMSPRL